MMKHSKTGLFLMELIIGILFFSLASALCIQIFVKAHLMNEESIMKSQAMKIANNIIEIYKNDDLDDYFTQEHQQIYFDESGNNVSLKEANYIAEIKEDDNQISITISCHDEVVYSIDYQHYQQRTF